MGDFEAMSGRIRVAVVGLGFGAEFVPIYLDHPDVEAVSICDSSPARLRTVGDRFNIPRRFHDVSKVAQANDIDAVHLVTGIPDHATQTVQALNSGKH
jgi:predicted dehydrogenase